MDRVKASYDKDILWEISKKRGYQTHLIETAESVCNQSKVCIHTGIKERKKWNLITLRFLNGEVCHVNSIRILLIQ
jgi:hypothetical protein